MCFLKSVTVGNSALTVVMYSFNLLLSQSAPLRSLAFLFVFCFFKGLIYHIYHALHIIFKHYHKLSLILKFVLCSTFQTGLHLQEKSNKPKVMFLVLMQKIDKSIVNKSIYTNMVVCKRKTCTCITCSECTF